MERQGRRDTRIELAIRRALHGRGLRFRVDFRLEPELRTRGDIVFTRKKVVVFIDGCFWHACPTHSTFPKNNADWWREKLAKNVSRDRRTDRDLTSRGWTVIRVWEHEDLEAAVARIVAGINAADQPAARNSE